MSEDKPIRAGLIGYGYAGRTFHAPLVRSVDGLELAAVASQRGDEVRHQLGSVRVCDAAALIHDPEIDLIIVACPNVEHFRLAYAALKAGKHIVVEKPFTVTLSEARTLRDVAAVEDRLLTVFQNRRWDSEVLALKDVLSQGILGRIVHFECRMSRYRPTVRSRWREDPGIGAGLWFDLGPHLIDLTVHLFSLPQSVNANFAILRERGGAPTTGPMCNSTTNAFVSSFRPLCCHPGPTLVRSLTEQVQAGPNTGPMSKKPNSNLECLPSTQTSGSIRLLRFCIRASRGGSAYGLSDGKPASFLRLLRDAILCGKPVPVSPRDAIAVMAILEASIQSGAEARTLPIPLSEEERAEWRHD